MVSTKFIIFAAFGTAVSAYPDFLTNPELRWVGDWKRAAAERREAAAAAEAEPGCPMAALHARAADSDAGIAKRAVTVITTTYTSTISGASSTMTRGSQTGITQPCFNVYQAPPPANNPGGPGPDGQAGFGYQAPTTNDVRSPCPALNTLANHGYLPRDGRLINGTTLVSAFANGWGIDESVITVPKTNALSICGFQSGGSENDQPYEQCEAFDLNILNTPHVFEHDHSLSRNDYMPNFSNAPFNNHVFNGTVFNSSLAVLNNSCYMTIPQANEVRLQREVDQFLGDRAGWFTLAPSTQETEIGFIFAVMSENNQPGGSRKAAGASARVNWWQYWFMYESFPTPLGWVRPSPAVNNSFVLSISSLVEGATITSTPKPFFTEFISGPTGTFPSTSTSGTPSFNPTLPNLYTTNPHLKLRAAEAVVTPEAQTF